MKEPPFLIGHTIEMRVPLDSDVLTDNWHNWYNDFDTTRHNSHGIFPTHNVTDEDGSRTELYRKMAQSAVPVSGEGHSIARFLGSLSMKMTIHDRGIGDRTRAVQLINKTNQFNINGVRREDEEIKKLLKQGCKLYTSTASRTAR